MLQHGYSQAWDESLCLSPVTLQNIVAVFGLLHIWVGREIFKTSEPFANWGSEKSWLISFIPISAEVVCFYFVPSPDDTDIHLSSIQSKALVRSQVFREDSTQCRIGAVHPSTWRHTVGHVHNLVLNPTNSNRSKGAQETEIEAPLLRTLHLNLWEGHMDFLRFRDVQCSQFVRGKRQGSLYYRAPNIMHSYFREIPLEIPQNDPFFLCIKLAENQNGYSNFSWPQKLTSPRCLACQCRSNTCRTLGRSPGTGKEVTRKTVINVVDFLPQVLCHQQLVWKLNFQWYKFPLKHWISKALETVVKSRWQSPLPKNTDLVFGAMINNTNRSGGRHLFSKWYTLRDICTMYGILTNIWVV